MTEKQIEAYLESETRMLTMPNGQQRAVRQFNLLWSVFDDIQGANMFSSEKMIALADSFSRRKGIPFEEGLQSICGEIHRQVKRW